MTFGSADFISSVRHLFLALTSTPAPPLGGVLTLIFRLNGKKTKAKKKSYREMCGARTCLLTYH